MMTLDEAIKHAENIAEENQRVVDTGIVFNDVTIDMLCCDDTEVIEEHLANYQRCAEDHKQLAAWLRDYKRLKEQEPCEDAISREQAIKQCGFGMTSLLIADSLRRLPFVNPQPKTGHWIPVSERLPEEDGQYLITVKYKHVNDSYEDVYAEYGEWYDGRWDMFCFGHCGEVEEIIAWMPYPLPAPYEPQAESEVKE